MSFGVKRDLVRLTHRDISTANNAFKLAIRELRPAHRKLMDRLFLSELSSSEFVALTAISARTLSWNKIIEVIPLQTFRGGMFDPINVLQHQIDSDGLPYFSGTRLDKGTLRKALKSLSDFGLIERFVVESAGRDVFAYMPISARVMASYFERYALENWDELPEAIKAVASGPRSDLENRCIARGSCLQIDQRHGGAFGPEDDEE